MATSNLAAPPGGAPRIELVDEETVLIELADRRVLASATCPHRQGRLLFGHLDADRLQIRCPLHNSAFDLRSGDRVAGPACNPLRILAELPPGPGRLSEHDLRELLDRPAPEGGPDAPH